MADQWYAVIDKATGQAVSYGTVLAQPMPTDLQVISISGPPGVGDRWDATTRQLVPRPTDLALLKAALARRIAISAVLGQQIDAAWADMVQDSAALS